MYRFFVDKSQISQEQIMITGQDVNHIRNVLRMKPKEEILLSDGEDREYLCAIEELKDDEVRVRILDINGFSRELPVKVHLYQGLPKGDKMETVIQKMVELGVHRVIPTSTKRTIVKLDEKKAKSKVTRWNAISESAAKQSKRGIVPEVADVLNFAEALEEAKKLDVVLMPYEEADNMEETRQILGEINSGETVGIFIGPEGGFAKEEVEKAKAMGARPITLGKRILRTETAGMALMSVIMFILEE